MVFYNASSQNSNYHFLPIVPLLKSTMLYIINGRTYSNCDFKFFAFEMAVIKNDDVISYANISYLGW